MRVGRKRSSRPCSCTSLGSSDEAAGFCHSYFKHVQWGLTPEEAWRRVADNPWLAGLFFVAPGWILASGWAVSRPCMLLEGRTFGAALGHSLLAWTNLQRGLRVEAQDKP